MQQPVRVEGYFVCDVRNVDTGPVDPNGRACGAETGRDAGAVEDHMWACLFGELRYDGLDVVVSWVEDMVGAEVDGVGASLWRDLGEDDGPSAAGFEDAGYGEADGATAED